MLLAMAVEQLESWCREWSLTFLRYYSHGVRNMSLTKETPMSLKWLLVF